MAPRNGEGGGVESSHLPPPLAAPLTAKHPAISESDPPSFLIWVKADTKGNHGAEDDCYNFTQVKYFEVRASDGVKKSWCCFYFDKL